MFMVRFTGALSIVALVLISGLSITAVRAEQHSTAARRIEQENRDRTVPVQPVNPSGWRQFVPGLVLAPGLGLMPLFQSAPPVQGGPGGRLPPGSRGPSGPTQGQGDPRAGFVPQGTPQIH